MFGRDGRAAMTLATQLIQALRHQMKNVGSGGATLGDSGEAE
jgi:hypothetical protein